MSAGGQGQGKDAADRDAMRQAAEELRQKLAAVKKGGGEAAVKRHTDRGKLFVRRWVARDRHLIDLHGGAIQSPARSISPPRLPPRLHLVRRDRGPSLPTRLREIVH